MRVLLGCVSAPAGVKVGDAFLVDVGVSNSGPDSAVNVVFKIGRASCRERAWIWSVVGLHKKDGCSNDFAGHISCHLASMARGSRTSLHNLGANAVSPALLTLSNTVSSDTLDLIGEEKTA